MSPPTGQPEYCSLEARGIDRPCELYLIFSVPATSLFDHLSSDLVIGTLFHFNYLCVLLFS